MAKVLSSSEGSNRGAFTASDWALFGSLVLVWGSSFLLIALGLEAYTPGMVTWLRVTLGAAALWLMPRARRRVAREHWPQLLVLSVSWVAVPFTLFPLAQQWIPSAMAGMLNGSTPLVAAAIASIMLGRAPGRAQRWGLAVGLIGIVLIGLPSLDGGAQTLGVVLALAASMSYGLAINLAVPLTQAYGSLPVMARMLTVASILTLPYALVSFDANTPTAAATAAIAVLGVVGTGVGFAVMAVLASRVGSTRASFITYVIPAVAIGLGVVFLDESVAPLSLLGAALVMTGSILASRAEHPKP